MSRFAAVLLLGLAPAADGPPTEALDENARTRVELDAFWAEASRTVREGDDAGYAALYTDDAVFVNSIKGEVAPIGEQLAEWKPGFERTRAGEVVADVRFRFTTRLHGPTTAHETGLFRYVSHAPGEPVEPAYIRFEALLIREPDGWRWAMERQLAVAAERDWVAAGLTIPSPGSN